MQIWAFVVGAAVVAGCGRIGFDARFPPALDDAAATCQSAPGLIAYWPFDEGAGTVAYDLSAFAQIGHLSGGTTWTSGKISGALQFDGIDGTVTLQSTTGFAFDGGNGSWTMSYWVEPTSLSNRIDIRPFEIATCTDPAYIFSFVAADGRAAFAGYDTAANFAVTASNPGALTLGTWTHVAHVIDRASRTGQTYVDGAPSGGPDDLSAWVTPIDCSSPTFAESIGGWGTFYFAGALDDMRFYSRALTATEITALAARTTTGCD
jgi:hypothetical protein